MKKLFALLVVVFAAFMLVGCAPKDAAAAKEKLEKKDYAVAVDGTIIPTALKLLGVEDIETVLTATKSVEDKDGNKSAESVTAIKFADAKAAKAALEKIQDYAKKNGSETDVKKSGAWLFYGTEKGVKAFK